MNEALFVLGVAVALGCDAFAVGLAIGTRNPDRRQSFRLWWHFGLFQTLMTAAGWAIGFHLLRYIEAFDHWIAFGLMLFISLRMYKEALSGEDDEANNSRGDPTRGWSLMALCVATSMDALGVGFGMSIARKPLLIPALVIGVVAGLMTWSGVRLGKRLSARFGKRVELVGATILLIIAVKLLEI